MVKVGDSIPNIDLVERKPDAKVNLSKELGSGLIIGVPAAFSTSKSPYESFRGHIQINSPLTSDTRSVDLFLFS